MKKSNFFALTAVLAITFASCGKSQSSLIDVPTDTTNKHAKYVASVSPWVQDLKAKNPLINDTNFISVYFKFDTIVKGYDVRGIYFPSYMEENKDDKYHGWYYESGVIMYFRNIVTGKEYEYTDFNLNHTITKQIFMSKHVYDINTDANFKGYKSGDAYIFHYDKEDVVNAEFQFLDIDIDGKDELLICSYQGGPYRRNVYEVYEITDSTLEKTGKTIDVYALESANDDPVSNWDTIYTYNCKDGHSRVFCDVYGSDNHFLYALDENNYNDAHLVDLVYQRYDSTNFLEDGTPCAFQYMPSPNGDNLYIVTRVFANSNGWTTEYQLFQVNCETLNAKFICDCAAIAVTNNGFVVAKARLTNRETSTCTADEIWVMNDVYLDWNGRLNRISSEEYDCKTMDNKYKSGEYTYVKGFYGTIE